MVKPAGVKFPAKEVFETMFDNNPDGCGFMFNNNFDETTHGKVILHSRNKVSIYKGFMVFEDFWTKFNEIFDNCNDISKTVVFHFRVRTHGNSDAGATQPIPVVTKNKQLRQTHVKCDVAMAHNGIITDYCDVKSKLSDSQKFARDYLTVMKLYQDITAHKAEAIRTTIGPTNKMVIMNSRGEYCVIGDFNEHEGCFYSNFSWEPYVYTKGGKGLDFYGGYYSWGEHVKKSRSKYDKSLKDWDWYDYGY